MNRANDLDRVEQAVYAAGRAQGEPTPEGSVREDVMRTIRSLPRHGHAAARASASGAPVIWWRAAWATMAVAMASVGVLLLLNGLAESGLATVLSREVPELVPLLAML